MVPGTTFPENCCTKAELATLELQEQPLFDPYKYFDRLSQWWKQIAVVEFPRSCEGMHRDLVYRKYI